MLSVCLLEALSDSDFGFRAILAHIRSHEPVIGGSSEGFSA